MDKTLIKAYQTIKTIVQSGRIGIPQVCVCSVNDASGAFDERAGFELSLMAELLGNVRLDKEARVMEEKPYCHGFIAREYENGAIARYTYISAPTADHTAFTVYGTGGEIRYDTQTGKVVTFDLIPDHQGETLTY